MFRFEHVGLLLHDQNSGSQYRGTFFLTLKFIFIKDFRTEEADCTRGGTWVGTDSERLRGRLQVMIHFLLSFKSATALAQDHDGLVIKT